MDLKRTFGAVVISGAGLATMTQAFTDESDPIADLINGHFDNGYTDVVHEPIENPVDVYIDFNDEVAELINAAEQAPPENQIHFIPSVSVPALSGQLSYILDGVRGEFDVSSSLDLPREPETQSSVAVSYSRYEDLLTQINDRINAEPYITDQENFGQSDLWSLLGDDCEDKVLKKYKALVEAGFPPEAMRVAVGVLPEGGHAVLAVRTYDRGDVLLDNYNAEILPYDPNTTTGFRAIGVSSVENFMRLGAINPVPNPDPVVEQAIKEQERMYAPIDDTQPEVPLPRPRPPGV